MGNARFDQTKLTSSQKKSDRVRLNYQPLINLSSDANLRKDMADRWAQEGKGYTGWIWVTHQDHPNKAIGTAGWPCIAGVEVSKSGPPALDTIGMGSSGGYWPAEFVPTKSKVAND